MQAKYCLLFVLLIGSIVVSTDGFSPVGKVGKETCTVKMFDVRLCFGSNDGVQFFLFCELME